MDYFLKHENTTVARFEVDEGSWQIKRVAILEAKALPVIATDSASLKTWLTERAVPRTRDGLVSELREMGYKNNIAYMFANLGLSLTDHYWICAVNDTRNWHQVNCYENAFSGSRSLGLKEEGITPNATLQGNLQKKWIIDAEGRRKLIKGNYSTASYRQSMCEVLATEIHKRQSRFGYISFNLSEVFMNGRKVIGCECDNFTDDKLEFVPAYEVIYGAKKAKNESYFECYISRCAEYGLDVRSFLEYQILTDFIITNNDRHLNNFGILRRADNFKWVCSAPIFDSGNAMFYDKEELPRGYKEFTKIDTSSFCKKEMNLLKYVKNRDLVDIRFLPDTNFVFNLFVEDNYPNRDIAQRTAERLVQVYQYKIAYLKAFQNGAEPWKYGFKL